MINAPNYCFYETETEKLLIHQNRKYDKLAFAKSNNKAVTGRQSTC